MKNITHKFLLARQTYFLLFEPIEEMIRERREYYLEKEFEYKFTLGTMNHFWFLTQAGHVLNPILNKIQARLLSSKYKYVVLVSAGDRNSYLPNFYRTRFTFTAKGRLNQVGSESQSIFTKKKIEINPLWR